jgi:hypothetical protein
MGIGSGVNVIMLGVDWRPTPVGGNAVVERRAAETTGRSAAETTLKRVGPLVVEGAPVKNRV